jgi:hypothetical protein
VVASVGSAGGALSPPVVPAPELVPEPPPVDGVVREPEEGAAGVPLAGVPNEDAAPASVAAGVLPEDAPGLPPVVSGLLPALAGFPVLGAFPGAPLEEPPVEPPPEPEAPPDDCCAETPLPRVTPASKRAVQSRGRIMKDG